jgi:hypothetical protein
LKQFERKGIRNLPKGGRIEVVMEMRRQINQEWRNENEVVGKVIGENR